MIESKTGRKDGRIEVGVSVWNTLYEIRDDTLRCREHR